MRKTEIEKEKTEIKMEKIIRNDVQKMIRELANEESQRKMLQRLRLQTWYMIIVLSNLGQTVNVKLQKQKKIHEKQMRLTFLLKKFFLKINSSLLKKAQKRETRFALDLRL